MSVVVEQTIPFQSESLDLADPDRWTKLLPLMRPSVKRVALKNEHMALIDTALQQTKFVQIAVVSRPGNFSSKLLADGKVTAIISETQGSKIPAKELDELLQKKIGLIVIRSGKKRFIEALYDNLFEVEVDGDLECDHLTQILSVANDQTRSSMQIVSELVKVFIKTATTVRSTFLAEVVDGNPATVNAEGRIAYRLAQHAIERDLKDVMKAHATQEGRVTYSIHYSDINGLSRLENYIIGLGIAKFMDAQSLPYSLSSSALADHDSLARGFALSVCQVSQDILPPQPQPSTPLNFQTTETSSDGTSASHSAKLTFSDVAVHKRITSACNALISSEPTITKYDEIVGDGDCGYTLRDGAKQVLSFISGQNMADLPRAMSLLVSDLEVSMGGTSGALYCIFLTALSGSLARSGTVAEALKAAMDELLIYTRARLGDRTMLDALIPFVDELRRSGDVKAALEQAEAGVETTKELKASLGRSTYLDESATRGVPDPGAYGLLVLLKGICADGND